MSEQDLLDRIAALEAREAALSGELEQRNRDVTEALDQQTAMAEVLSIIATSTTDAQPVLQAIAAAAVRVFSAHDSAIHFLEGETLVREAVAFGEGSSEEARTTAFITRRSGETPGTQHS
jgi:hypothetical protein